VWCYAQTILFTAQGTNPENGYWPSFTFQQCVFGSRLQRRVKQGQGLWSLIKGAAIWLISTSRNAVWFSVEHWPVDKIMTMMWSAILDQGRTAWLRTKMFLQQQPCNQQKFLDRFDKDWYVTAALGLEGSS
jgi:hypothetical protein